ncbi:MAG: cell division protein FtsN [Cellvibrionaceae bacterium]|jgi:cell division protein FtsN
MTQHSTRSRRTSTAKKTGRKARNNTRRKPARKTKIPTWVWLIIGVLVAVLVALSLYIANQKDPSLTRESTVAEHTETAPETPKPRFDFYRILKQRTLEVPDRSDEIIAKVPVDVDFYLQAGSFRNSGDADEVRAQLLLLNLEASVEPGKNQGQTWHRVIVGPFDSRSKVAKARGVLVSNNLSPLLLKRKNSP